MNKTSKFPACSFQLPDWIQAVIQPGQIIANPEDRLSLAIELSKQQVLRQTGGPFGAIVCELDSGKAVGAGVNLVVPTHMSIAHAEVVAWSVAQAYLGTFDLGGDTQPALGIYSSAQPCIACWGGIFWTGIKHLAYAATKQDVETVAGFDEGPMPDDWESRLQQRGISVSQGLREPAVAVLEAYRKAGGTLYNASA